ncbi:MAG: 4-hydroxythreonine-4-phosphate dehydrogenase PdxA [Christensenellaceae bacterium]|nr:4-hydroxythreonine-4-phosphate dehydrogenase PdxA [Christensenellaceae bacterium]
MNKLLIIADDFTGALDTGVKLAARGAGTRVFMDLPSFLMADALPARVTVVCTHSRHMPAEAAYRAVYKAAARGLKLGANFIYKKTDSALRGNIGIELCALMHAAGEERLAFLPAHPAAGRTTEGGMQLVEGTPVHQSVFGADPFAPVTQSHIPTLLAEQGGGPAFSAKPGCPMGEKPGIYVFDAKTPSDLARDGNVLLGAGQLRIAAGCAGFGAVLGELLLADAQKPRALPPLPKKLLVVCGSLNPVTRAQLQFAAGQGALWLTAPLQSEQLQKAADFDGDLLLDAGKAGGAAYTPVRQQAAARLLAKDAEALMEALPAHLPLITGGDTLAACLKQLNVGDIAPVAEPLEGVVLACCTVGGRERYLLTKSGGFGEEDLIPALKRALNNKENDMDRPIIAITMGDPAGIGPEITVKALADAKIFETCRPLVVGDAAIMARAARLVGQRESTIRRCERVEEAVFTPGTIDVLHMPLVMDAEGFPLGQVSEEGGRAAFCCVKKAIDLAMEGRVQATCTNALNKEAMNKALAADSSISGGITHFDGHTEIYAHYTGTEKYTMMLAHHELRVVHVSTHCSLREACDRVKKERVAEVIRIAHKACLDMGIAAPKVAVAGLNPHCGENGLFGKEEIEEIAPAIEECRGEGINAIGPLPADSVFSEALGGLYHVVVCMYHDQGHIPLKTVGFVYDRKAGTYKAVEGVNITLGLPIIRTSVDHGTGFALAGTGKANELSLKNAIAQATQMARAKEQH